MGLFGRKKKKAVDSAGVSDELLAVIGAAVSASNDSAHIVAIAAAVAAYESDSVRSDLLIRKIDRTAGCVPAWGVAGNREAIDARRM
ncbi:MAG: hypothetical protein LBH63_04725 [Clostridiales Family XIII bacterium]|nr:hypothetical protein [Clostridiales Family XIII bacterium]